MNYYVNELNYDSEILALHAAEGVPRAKRLRGAGWNWTKITDFEDRQSAIERVNNEGCWSISRSYQTIDGEKVQYRCNKVRKDGEQCQAAIYLLYHAGSVKVSYFSTTDEHDHRDKLPSRGLEKATHAAVIDIFDKQGIEKPKAILAALRRQNLPEPPMSKLKNFLQLHKKKVHGPLAFNVGTFDDWCKERLAFLLDQPNKAFVVRHAVTINADGTASFRVFMATPRLLDFVSKSNVVHADATYKLNWERCPVFVIGTSDKDRHFHPFGIGVSSDETSDSYAFMFQSVVDGAQRLFNFDYRPTVLVADGASAITNGFEKVFGNQGYTRIMCWAHVVFNVDQHLKKFADKNLAQRIRNDIHELQTCESVDIFDAVVPLFFAKYRQVGDPDTNAFLAYFELQWILRNKNWLEGADYGSPSTDNCLESFNRYIKQEKTFRNRLPLPHFLHLLEMSALFDWSWERDLDNVNCKKFCVVPTKTTSVWTDAYQWALLPRALLSLNIAASDVTYFFTPANGAEAGFCPRVVTAYHQAFEQRNWDSFDNYGQMRRRLWVISLFGNQIDSTSCNCPEYLKKKLCKHTLGLAIRKGWVAPPLIAQTIPIGEQRGRGRPLMAQAGDALVVN